jgi:DNA-binding CsgD family transcriptional regulator
MLKKEVNMRKNDVKPADDEPVESYRMAPSVVFAIELGNMQTDFSVRLRFLNHNFFVLTEYSREELNERGFDYLDKLIARSDQKIVLRMIKNLTQKGYLATEAGVFKVLTRDREVISVFCRLKVIGLHPDKSLKSLSGCMMEFDENMWNREDLVLLLKKKRSKEVMDKINDLTYCEMLTLKFTGKGYSEAVIASFMDISVNTVKSHRKSLREKLDCNNDAALAAFAAENFLL